MKDIETRKETVSAMLDDELRTRECECCSDLIKQQPELRDAWDIYALIGDVLRGTPVSTMPRSFADRMTAEPTVLAPRSLLVRRRIKFYAWPAAAAAAGIGFVAWITLSVLPVQNVEMASANRAAVQAQATPAPSDSGRVAGPEIEDYLLAHQPYSSTPVMQGVAPYIQVVSDPSESVKQ